MADYPCKSCTRVEDPENCENKKCPVWQEWFMRRWNEMWNSKEYRAVDTVKVVRCKNCEFFHEWVDSYMCGKHNIFVKLDDFCSYGERKDNDI